MVQDRAPVFLERQSYRRRRVGDAARVIPVIGGVLVMLPLLWPRDGEDTVSTVSAFLYVFGIWALMIGVAAVLAPFLRRDEGG